MTESSRSRFYVISLDEIDSTQTRQVQSIIERTAESWWHQQAHLWLVQGGGTPLEWRDTLSMLLKGVGGTVLVLELPRAEDERRYSGFGNGRWWPWLRETYVGRTGDEKRDEKHADTLARWAAIRSKTLPGEIAD